ncbi:hypothetical protein TNCV_4825941 [Trichonephila clavipes]|uniref:Uncharacterized protein n=1 Tax=Trichonephila clavipes TaxID=2585209 RepID=A0A8X6V744_TRICX|nr:hypothetical protein TNCV_4825941 [Trichonephila clavipes]
MINHQLLPSIRSVPSAREGRSNKRASFLQFLCRSKKIKDSNRSYLKSRELPPPVFLDKRTSFFTIGIPVRSFVLWRWNKKQRRVWSGQRQLEMVVGDGTIDHR